MTREVLLANADQCMDHFWTLLAVMLLLVAIVMIPVRFAEDRIDSVRRSGKEPSHDDLRKISRLNRYIMLFSSIAILALFALFPLHQWLLPLPADKLVEMVSSGEMERYVDLKWTLFKPVMLFFLVLANMLLISIHLFISYRYVTLKSVLKQIHKKR